MNRSGNALLLAAVVVAGCGGSDASTSSSATKQATRADAALSEAEYQERLDRAGDAVEDAMTRARKAGSAEKLSARLDAAAGDLEDASGALQHPSASAAVQDASAALSALATEFTSMAGRVQDAEFCTAPAALAQLTRSGAVRDVRAAAEALRGEGFKAGGLTPRTQRKPSVKLANGAVLSRKGATGPGELVIRNGGSRDGVVKIVAGGNRTTIHVRRKSSTTVTGIADANYRVFFASGSSWDGKRNTFSRNCSFSAFDDRMKFTSGGGQYTRYTITLNPVAGGNAPTNAVEPGDFPRD
jgi:hypothetical protein